VRAPLVEAEQDGSIRIQDLTKVVMARRPLGLAEERLVPFEATANVADADDRPCAFHRSSTVGLTRHNHAAVQQSITRDHIDALAESVRSANSKAFASWLHCLVWGAAWVRIKCCKCFKTEPDTVERNSHSNNSERSHRLEYM
jgi:hypothetical protein